MELDELDAAVILLLHHRPCQTPCGESLADAGSALQNDVLLIAQNGHKVLVALFAHIHFIQKIAFCVSIDGCLRGNRVFFPNHIEDEVVFASGELEQAALRILEILHALQFRAFLQRCIVNGGGQAFYFFKEQLFAVLFCADTANCYNLLYRIGFIANDHIANFRIQEVLENTPLVSIFIVKRIGLHLSDSNVGKAPDSRIRIQPPIAMVFFGSGSCIQFNITQICLIKCFRKFISQFPNKAAILAFVCITPSVKTVHHCAEPSSLVAGLIPAASQTR